MKFKIGDRVKVVDGVFKGNVGIIDSIDEEDYNLSYHVTCFSGSQIWVAKKVLELVIDDRKKTFSYGSSNIAILGNLKKGDCFRFLEGDYKEQYGVLCSHPDKYTLDKDSIPVVIFAEFGDFPMIEYVSSASKVKRVALDVTFKEE